MLMGNDFKLRDFNEVFMLIRLSLSEPRLLHRDFSWRRSITGNFTATFKFVILGRILPYRGFL